MKYASLPLFDLKLRVTHLQLYTEIEHNENKIAQTYFFLSLLVCLYIVILAFDFMNFQLGDVSICFWCIFLD